MTPRLLALLSALTAALTHAASAEAADAKAPKVTFADQVAPIFRNRCNSCHNADKQKGGLNLETYGGAMQGGSSGKVVEAGDLESSTLYQLVAHVDQPFMPPNSPKIPDAEIDVLKLWIEGGALETSGSVAATQAKPKFEFKLDPDALGKPSGPAAMPENLLTEPEVVSPRPPAIVALASSPWAPVAAVGGHKQVLLYRTTDNHLTGVLPFPEGTIYTLKFSRNGSLLLAGGGRGGQSGLVVFWDVKTGKRVFEIGKEYDVVLGADISPDHGQVALGGPGKVVRVYGTADGALQFELKKHTEWITAVEFSPDGVLLATGDRNNGLVVWEAQTGREFHDLRGHNGPITDLSWRLDSNVLASSSEDGAVKLWEMENGGAIKSWGAHGGGTASVRFAKDGRLVTAGRDRLTRLWDQNGAKQRDFEAFGDLALEAIFTHDDALVIAGDWTGELRVFDAQDGRRLTNLAANPAPIARRLELATQAVPPLEAAADAALKAMEPFQTDARSKADAVAAATTARDEAAAKAGELKAAADKAEAASRARTAEETAAAAAVTVAQEAATRAAAEKAAAEKAVPETDAAEKAAGSALAAARELVGRALAAKAAEDKAIAEAVEALQAAKSRSEVEARSADLAQRVLKGTELTAAIGLAGGRQSEAFGRWEQALATRDAAPTALLAATARLTAATETLTTAQAVAADRSTRKAESIKVLADARAAQAAADALVTTAQGVVDQANAAKAAADKTLAEKKAAADNAVAARDAARAEAQALAVEKKQFDATRSAAATTASQGS